MYVLVWVSVAIGRAHDFIPGYRVISAAYGQEFPTQLVVVQVKVCDGSVHFRVADVSMARRGHGRHGNP